MVDSTNVLLIVVTVLTAVFIWSRRTYVYWQRRHIKFVQPTHLLGNLIEVLKQQSSFALQLRNFYFDKNFENEPLVGIYLFHQPALLIRDLNIVRTILIDDFVSFSNRFARCDQHEDKIAAYNLFFVKNPEWREIRTKLAPAFTDGKICQMFELMQEIGYDLEVYLNRLTDKITGGNSAAIVQIKEICDLYAIDMIASIAFGFRSYSLRNKKSEIGVHSRQMFLVSLKRAVDFGVIFFLPKLIQLLKPKFFTPEHADFLRRTVIRVLRERELNGHLRNDLIEMLITFKKEADLNQDKTHFSHQDDYLVAQASVFEIAGIETCSATMVFALYELAKQPIIQKRLREEILTTFKNNIIITYKNILNMDYLGMIVDETLRKYPIIPYIERECTPINKKRFYSFRPHVECFARRGMPVFISNLAIHHDPKLWPNPEEFDPERFSADNKQYHIPMSYLPFGAGPHNCIGSNFGQLQIKLGLIYFLKNHRVEICDKTVDSIRFDPKFALLSSDREIYLKIIKC